MHELAVTESILDICNRHASEAGAARVVDIDLTIGQLSSIVDDSIQFYWDLISKDSLCEGAVLHFHRIPARLLCQTCNMEYGIENGLEPCPSCAGFNVKIIAGEEFWVDSIAIEREEERIV